VPTVLRAMIHARWLVPPCCAAVLLYLCAWAMPASAHPHIFIDWDATVVAGADGIQDIRETWTFDEAFSGAAMDPGRPVGAGDVAAVQERLVPAFMRHAWFTRLAIDSEPIELGPMRDFVLSATSDGRMVWQFTLPILKRPIAVHQGLTLSVFDAGYYVAFSLRAGHAVMDSLDATDGLHCRTSQSQRIAGSSYSTDADMVICGNPVVAARSNTSGWGASLAKAQRVLNAELTLRLRAASLATSPVTILSLLALCFLYGALHAVGPGHGKAIVGTWIVTRGERWRMGLLLGVGISFAQGLTAIATVMIMSLVLHLGRIDVLERTAMLETVSYGLIVLIGIGLLYRSLTGDGTCLHHGHDHAHDHTGVDTHLAVGARGSRAMMVAAAGLIPCPSTFIVLLLGQAENVLLLGVVSVMAMSAGMAVTLAATGAAGGLVSGLVDRMGGRAGRRMLWITRAGTVVASVALISLAAALFEASLGRL
jgi:nickel/cobalt transporter (NicO) family protein